MSGDRFAGARSVADAVLYEGYLLYPYRHSATKNQLRWQFGVLVPAQAAVDDPSERSSSRTEVVVDPGQSPVLRARLRFLQVQRRTANGEPPWDEAVEQECEIAPVKLLPLAFAQSTTTLHVDGGEEVDGAEHRRREPLDLTVAVATTWADGPGVLLKVAVTVTNSSAWREAGAPRDVAVRHSPVAVHVLLAVDDGAFVSLLDPPDEAIDAAKGCASEGTHPVLVGPGDATDVVLSSPIILYDHPAVAPESEGDLFDATEIDEILALRVLTLTDDEKAEARRTDARAAAIVDRIEDFGPDVWKRLHGTMRDVRELREIGGDATSEQLPWWEPTVDEGYDPYADALMISGCEVKVDTSVILRPNRRADAHDMFLDGMRATVVGVFTDVDDSVLLQVTLDDDPASEMLSWQRRGYFFHPDEVEVIT